MDWFRSWRAGLPPVGGILWLSALRFVRLPAEADERPGQQPEQRRSEEQAEDYGSVQVGEHVAAAGDGEAEYPDDVGRRQRREVGGVVRVPLGDVTDHAVPDLHCHDAVGDHRVASLSEANADDLADMKVL